MQRTAVSLPQHSRKRISLPCYLFFPCWIHCSATASLRQGFPRLWIPPGCRCGTEPSLEQCHFPQAAQAGSVSLAAQLSQGAVPAVHRRCCPWHSASCSAWPWGISGGPGARRAARGSRGPAAAPPAAPPAACRGCSLRRAEASSSPSDPSGSPAARQRTTRQAHPDTGIVHSNITAPQNPTETWQFGAKEKLCLCPGAKAQSHIWNYSRIPAALPNPPLHQEQAQ